jgi:hypothetical protein
MRYNTSEIYLRLKTIQTMWRKSFISLAAASITVLIPIPSLALEPDAVKNLASKFVVKIEGSDGGTGFIVRKNGSRYTVLTARHVVESSTNYSAITVDGKKHYIENALTRKFPTVDLAEIQFISNNEYGVAELNNTVVNPSSLQKVYSYGFNSTSEAFPVREWQFLPGSITGSLSKSSKGYSLVYSLPSVPGFSGAPVLDEAGKVIGVYGFGESGTTVTLGIPITTYYAYSNFSSVYFRNNSTGLLKCDSLTSTEKGNEYRPFMQVKGNQTEEFNIFGGTYQFRCYHVIPGVNYYTYFEFSTSGIYDFLSLDVPCDDCILSKKNLTRLATIVVFPNGKFGYTIVPRKK